MKTTHMTLVVFIFALAVLVAGCTQQGTVTEKKEGGMMEGSPMDKAHDMETGNEWTPEQMAEMEKEGMPMEGGMMKPGEQLAGTSAPLYEFSQEKYDEALRSGKIIMLYFYASWCPNCKAEFPVMESIFNGLTTDKMIGFRVHYNDDQTDDNARSLAKQFGIAYQHTKVILVNGKQVLKSPEAWDKERYKNEIAKVIG